MSQRCRKKVLEKTSWYKGKRKREDEEGEEEERNGERKRKKGRVVVKKKEENRIGKIKAVMFVPYTHHSELARDLRQAEEKLLDLTG